jgi:hypothetical protein
MRRLLWIADKSLKSLARSEGFEPQTLRFEVGEPLRSPALGKRKLCL